MEERPQGLEQMIEQQPQGMQPEQMMEMEPQPQEVEHHEALSSVAGDETLPQQGAVEESYPFVYVIGQVNALFPSLGVEKEFAQATGRLEATAGLTDQEATSAVLSEDANRYLARRICYVLEVGGTDAYVLQPRDTLDLPQLVEAVSPLPNGADGVSVVVGLRGPMSPPEMCNGLELPIVVFDRIFRFTVDEFVQSIPRPESIPETEEDRFRTTAREVFNRVRQAGDNLGNTDEDRAKNFALLQYQGPYATATQQYQNNFSLEDITVLPSPLSGARRLRDVIFQFRERQTNMLDRYYLRVDTTEMDMFLDSPMQPYLGQIPY